MDFKRSSRKRFGTLFVFTLLITALVVSPVLAASTTPIFRLKWDSSDTSTVTYPELLPLAKLDSPSAVEATATNVYVTDTLNDRIQIFTSTGAYVAAIGPSFQKGAVADSLAAPAGITVDSSGNIYVADSMNNRVIKFDATRTYVTSIGTYGNGYTKTPPVVQFRNPNGLAVDNSGGFLYVVDTNNSRVIKLNTLDLSPAGNTPLGTGLNQPRDVAVNTDGASIFVADTASNRLVKIIVASGAQTVSAVTFTQPAGVSIDTLGNLYVTNTNSHSIYKLTNAMVTNKNWGSTGTADGLFKFPSGIAALGEDVVYVADTDNDRIQYFEPNQPITDLSLSTSTILEGNTVGQVIGIFSATDPNVMDVFRYEWATPTGETCDNGTHFNLSGANLTAKEVYDYENGHDFNVCIKVLDSNNQNSRIEVFPISIMDGSDAPIITNTQTTYSLGEYTARTGNTTNPGVTLVTLNVTDNDVNDDFTYSIAGGTYAQAFEIVKDPTDKKRAFLKIWNNGATPPAYQTLLDFEAPSGPSGTVKVRVTDQKPTAPGRFTDIDFTINLTNQQDPPIINIPGDPVTAPFEVDELAPVGTVVGPRGVNCAPVPTPAACLITLTDQDAGTTLNSLSLSFNPSKPSDYFAVQKVTSPTASLWKVVTKAPLPGYRDFPTIDFFLRAYDNVNYTWLTLPIVNTDSNNAPVLLADYYMHEDRVVGWVLDLADDPDVGDTLTYTITSGNVGVDPEHPTFGVVNGQIQIIDDTLIDYLHWLPLTPPYFQLGVTVQDSGEPPSAPVPGTVNIHITEGNRAPVFVTQPAPVLTTPENTLESPLGANIVGHISATDMDHNELTFSTTPGGPFLVSTVCTAPCEANVYLDPSMAGQLDFETAASYSLSVTVTDGIAPPVTQIFSVTITNVNERITIDNEATPIPVQDRWEPGHVIGAVAWTDLDGNANTQPIYNLTGEGDDQFGIDPATGQIYILPTANLHYYLQSVYRPMILIRDLPSGGFIDSAQFMIQLSDDNDPPAFEDFLYFEDKPLPENQPDGTTVGSFIVFDENGQDFDVTIEGGNGAFSITTAPAVPPTILMNGITILRKMVTVTVADTTKIDYDTAPNHQIALTLRGAELGATPLTGTHTYQINLSNVNEAPATSNQQFYTYQNATFGVVAGTIIAQDPDAGTTLRYNIVNDGSAGAFFEINPATGAVSVKRGVSNLLLPGNYIMTVNVWDSPDTSGLHSENATITITVTPKSDPSVTALTVSAPEILIGSPLRYNVTVTNEATGISSPFGLQLKLPAGVGFEIPGSTAGCSMKTIDTVECVSTPLQPNGQPGSTRSYIINAYLYSSTTSNLQLKTVASLALNDTFNDLNTNNNTREVLFTTRKSITITNQNFEGPAAAPQDFTRNLVPFTDKETAPACVTPNPESFAGLFSNDTLKYTKALIPHSVVDVSFDLYLPYSWDGAGIAGPDRWKFCLGNCQAPADFLVNTTFSNTLDLDESHNYMYLQSFPDSFGSYLHDPQTGNSGVNTLGYYMGSSLCAGDIKDSKYTFNFKLDHADPNLILNFIGEGLQAGPREEKWGIDNFRVVITGERSYPAFLPIVVR